MNRLKVIELFAGKGSQHKALSNLGAEFEVVGISEWTINSIIAYDSIHTNDNVDYSLGKTKQTILHELEPFTFSSNGKTPCNIARTPEKKLRQLYNANLRSKNLGDITKLTTLPQCDLLTYSFPCQDLSMAGKREGLGKGTRSGLLYEVERLLETMTVKPKFLLLENVKGLITKEFKPLFIEWLDRLSTLGYTSTWDVLNAKNYGVPQSRERVFALSMRNDVLFDYTFPKPFDNGLRIRDIIEENVDQSYYIDNDRVKVLLAKVKNGKVGVLPSGDDVLVQHGFDSFENRSGKWNGTSPCLKASGSSEPKVLYLPINDPSRPNKNMNGRRIKGEDDPMFTLTNGDIHGIVQIDNLLPDRPTFKNPQTGRVYSDEGTLPTLTTKSGGDVIKVTDYFTIRKLTPLEYFRLQGFSDADYNKCVETGLSKSTCYGLAGNSITVTVLMGIFGELLGIPYKEQIGNIYKWYNQKGGIINENN
jgi:DNA (cytosine-5)-methyltransferase 1